MSKFTTTTKKPWRPSGRPLRTPEELLLQQLVELELCFSVSESGCHEWTGALFESGYGRLSAIRKDSELNERAHIAAWQVKKGPTNGLFVCHACDNKRCVNVDHLWLGTNQENQVDAVKKGVFDRYWTEERRERRARERTGELNPMYGMRGELAPCYGRTGADHPLFNKKKGVDFGCR